MLRVALTPSFVGPRGQASLEANDKLWFALQIGGGFDADPANKLAALPYLWPWSLNVLSGDTVQVSAYSIAEDDAVTAINSAELTPSSIASAKPAFHDKLKQAITRNYETASVLESLSLRTYFPSEIPGIGTQDDIENALRKNVPSRLAFLSTLPPGLAEPLLATTYVQIERNALFDRTAAGWEPKSRYLWLAPARINAEAGQLDLVGHPAKDPALEIWKQAYAGDAAAYGALVDLNDVATPDVRRSFDLTSYWLPVSLGDHRFAMAEGWVVGILDPFSELRELDSEEYRSRLAFQHVTTGAQSRGVTADEIALLRKLWLVDMMRSRLSRAAKDWIENVLKTALAHLVSRVKASRTGFNVPPDKEFVDLIPDPLAEGLESDDLLDNLRGLARLLRIQLDNDRALLAAVASQAGESTILDILRRVFSRMLDELARTTTDNAAEWSVLNSTWGTGTDALGGTQAERAKRIEDRQLAQMHTAFAQILDDEGRAHLSALAKADSAAGTIAWFRTYLTDQIVERWRARFSDRTIVDALRSILLAEPANVDPDAPGELTLPIPAENILQFHGAPALDSIIGRYVEPFFEARVGGAPDAYANGDGVPAETGAEPVDLILGSADSRLIHENAATAPELPSVRDGGGDVFEDVVGHLLLVRRASGSQADLQTAEWRLPSAGLAALDRMTTQLFGPNTPPETWLPRLLPIPEENNFEDGVLRMDRSYDGQPRQVQNPVELAYCGTGTAESASHGEVFDQAPFYYQALGLFKGHAGPPNLALEAEVSAAPVMRYGDWYEFAAALVDNAGGLARELRSTEKPWEFDPTRLQTAFDVPDSCVVRYRRRRPVGELNVQPTSSGGWIPIPDGVSLRATEWWAAVYEETDNVVSALLFAGEAFSAERPSVEFIVSAPSIDEFTLLRWIVSPTDATPAQVEADKIDYKVAMGNILAARRATCAPGSSDAVSRLEGNEYKDAMERGFVHDPAVQAVGVEIDFFRPNGQHASIRLSAKSLDDVDNRDDLPHRKKHFEFKVSYAAGGTIPTKQELDALPVREIRFDLPGGHYCLISVYPLVAADDYENRFARMRPETFSVDANLWAGYVAFPPSRILVESADATLPDAEDCYTALQLAVEAESVVVNFDESRLSDPSLLQMVDRFVLNRDRWAWRNRPIFDGEVVPPVDEAHRRKLASGPPDDAFDESLRDDSEAVRNWEELASLDRGFAQRPQITGKWPRRPGTPDVAADVAPVTTVLQTDQRDGSLVGDYLRYGLELRSRYAPILQERYRSITAKKPIRFEGRLLEETRKRVVAPFPPTADIAPPKILAVLPLTRSLSDDPIAWVNRFVTPFLVLLDETWFRQYGVGERLAARLSLESPDIGEDITGVFPYRAGPLPDHHLPPSAPYKDPVSIEEDERNPVRLETFGPFGYTLDDTPNEALANASAFVVYPPPDDADLKRYIDAHWAFFVSFRRVIDYPGVDERESDASDVYPLYTLPDEATLVVAERNERVALELSRLSDEGRFNATPTGLTFKLQPAGMKATIPGTESRAEKAVRYERLRHYRHFLLVSEPMKFAGRNRTIERPVALLRFDESAVTGSFSLSSVGREPAGEALVGRVIEVMLNGKYGEDAPLDSVTSIKQFWNKILTPMAPEDSHVQDRTKMHDAWGMVRRISDSFDVVFDIRA